MHSTILSSEPLKGMLSCVYTQIQAVFIGVMYVTFQKQCCLNLLLKYVQ